jgi:GNAT superfamily N-acetyltransferase
MKLGFLADHRDAIPVVAKWYFDQWGHKISYNSHAKTCARLRENLGNGDFPICMVAFENRIPLGAARLKLHEMDIYPERAHWLGSVFVAPEARGRNIASKLAGKVAETATSLGVRSLYLQTERLDGGLYANLGWLPLEQVRYRGLDVLVMERRLF